MPALQVRLICGTAYEKDEFTEADLDPRVQYIAWGEEICPKTKRRHLQFFSYGAKMSKKAWEKIYAPHHIDLCNGNLYDQYNYTMKEDKWHELGVRPARPGVHQCALVVKKLIDEGQAPHVLMRQDEYFNEFKQHYRFYEMYHNVVRMEKLVEQGYRERETYILTGPAGTGKSKYVFEHHAASDIYIMPRRDGKWFGNYKGQPVVIFNDVSASDIMSVTDFLNVTDGYPIEVEVKGAFVPWSAETIYFTSNDAWEKWWKLTPDHVCAVTRRITACILFK